MTEYIVQRNEQKYCDGNECFDKNIKIAAAAFRCTDELLSKAICTNATENYSYLCVDIKLSEKCEKFLNCFNERCNPNRQSLSRLSIEHILEFIDNTKVIKNGRFSHRVKRNETEKVQVETLTRFKITCMLKINWSFIKIKEQHLEWKNRSKCYTSGYFAVQYDL